MIRNGKEYKFYSLTSKPKDLKQLVNEAENQDAARLARNNMINERLRREFNVSALHK
jgi:hypothetical protein